MKDPNGGDITGTVLESINASDRLETPFIGGYRGGLSNIMSGIWGIAAFNLDFWCNNGYASGVNPTHCTETGI